MCLHYTEEVLTTSQREILIDIANGLTTKSIAANRNLSAKTIEYHRAKLTNKLGLFSPAELTHWAIARNLIPIKFKEKAIDEQSKKQEVIAAQTLNKQVSPISKTKLTPAALALIHRKDMDLFLTEN